MCRRRGGNKRDTCFRKSGKGCRITSCPCALLPNGQLSESCKIPSLWQTSNPHQASHPSTLINTIFLQYSSCFCLTRTKLAVIVTPSRGQTLLTFMVAGFSVAVLYFDCFIQMTSFPVTKGFTALPVKTMLCPVVSVGKSFHTVYVLDFFPPLIALGVMETCMQK